MFPTKVISSTGWINCYLSGAASSGSDYQADLYIYVTNAEDGSVSAVKYNYSNLTWTDTWTALQSDLSIFRVINALYANGMFMLAGQFARNDEYIKHDPVPMVLRSVDGRTFAIDQFALLSKLGYRFGIKVTSTALYGSDSNRVVRGDLGAALGGAGTNIVTTISGDETNSNIASFSATTQVGSSRASLSLRAAGHEFEDDANVIRYSRCKVEVGFQSSTGVEWEEYDTYIVALVNVNYADGARGFDLELHQEALWRLETQTPPFYTEIIGKSGIYDELKKDAALEHLYPAPNPTTHNEDYFSLDFWGANPWDGEGAAYTGATLVPYTPLDRGGVNEITTNKLLAADYWYCFKSADIQEHIGSVDYPEVLVLPVKLSVYGWNEASLNMGADSSENGTEFRPYVLIQREDGEHLLPCTLYSSSKYLKRTVWEHTESPPTIGNTPVIYTIGDTTYPLLVGDKIIQVMFMAGRDYTSSDDFHWCCIERVRIASDTANGLRVKYDDSAGAAWIEVGSNENAPLSCITATTGLQLPNYGRFVMFSTRPSFMFDGSITANFSIARGTTPSPSGKGITAFGLVVLAEDAGNCIVGRYNFTTSKWQIVKVREGIETLLLESSTADVLADGTFTMHLHHRGSWFSLWHNQTLKLAYSWDESQGAIATNETGILHCGIYGEKTTVSFRTTGFSTVNSDSIPLLPDQDFATFETNFPTASLTTPVSVMIDGILYQYTSRPTLTNFSTAIGPYQCRGITMKSATWQDQDGNTFCPGLWFNFRYVHWFYDPSITLDCILAVANGYNWIMHPSWYTDSDVNHPQYAHISAWELETPDVWYLLRRSLHAAANLTEYSASFGDRCYITHGLRGIINPTGAIREHPHGSRCYLYGSEEVVLNWYNAFTGESDFTIKDMLKMVADTVGAKTTFSGDYSPAAINLVAHTETDFYPPA
jgi:hypothetical protein